MRLTATTPETDSFIGRWNDACDTITAHTSGSTGAPKEITLLKSDMLRSAEATCRHFSVDSSSLLVCPLSADYIAGKMMVVRAIFADAELIMEKPSNRPAAGDYGTVALLPIVPSQAPGLLERCAAGLRVRNVIVGGAPLSPEMETRLSQAPFAAYATYGMTETCSHVAVRQLGTGPFYEALPGITFDTDADSCLRVVAPRFSFGSLQTNDIVELADDRHFRWLGRRDNVIITGGLKVIPEEIENRVRDIVGHEFYFAGRDDAKWGQAVVMIVEAPDGIETGRLAAALRERLQKWEMPKEIIVRERLERTLSGKVIRNAE